MSCSALRGRIAAFFLSALLGMVMGPGARALTIDFDTEFHGVKTTLPNGIVKFYPDREIWSFSYWPGAKWPDIYGDRSNWIAANGDCETYVTPFITAIGKTPVPPS